MRIICDTRINTYESEDLLPHNSEQRRLVKYVSGIIPCPFDIVTDSKSSEFSAGGRRQEYQWSAERSKRSRYQFRSTARVLDLQHEENIAGIARKKEQARFL